MIVLRVKTRVFGVKTRYEEEAEMWIWVPELVNVSEDLLNLDNVIKRTRSFMQFELSIRKNVKRLKMS